jgi:hypothetical protein
MGSVTRSIKRLFARDDDVATRLRRVFTACPRGDGTKNINIRIFDKLELINEMASSADVENDLNNFLRGLASQTGLEASVVTQLSPITFQVTYANRMPDQNEIDRFGVHDFPIYFLTATGLSRSSSADVISLMVKHRIPELTWVARREPPSRPVLSEVRAYQIIERDWENKPTVLGFGIPGTYFLTNSQTICRTLGIIKMQGGMIENLQFMGRRQKLVSVLKHELGHIFGLVHEPNTLMDGDYQVNSRFASYSNDQLWVVGRALEVLLRN